MFVYQEEREICLSATRRRRVMRVLIGRYSICDGDVFVLVRLSFLVRGRSPAGLSLSADKYWGENHERTCSSIWAAPMWSCSAGYRRADLRVSARRRADHQHQHHERCPSLRRCLVRLGGCLSICNRGGQWSRGSDGS